jgi:hypothetical protein
MKPFISELSLKPAIRLTALASSECRIANDARPFASPMLTGDQISLASDNPAHARSPSVESRATIWLAPFRWTRQDGPGTGLADGTAVSRAAPGEPFSSC